MTKLQEIKNLYQETLRQVISSREEWLKFLNVASRMYKYNFPDQLLIYAQNPNAEACASIDVWNKSMHCWVNRGSKGIALIDRRKTGKNKLKYVFDVSNVHKSRNIGKLPYIWIFREEHKNIAMQNLGEQYSISLNNRFFAENIREIAEKIAKDEVEDNIEYIQTDIKDSYLTDVSVEELKKCYRTFLASSITYTVLARCGIDAEQEGIELDFANIHEFNSDSIILSMGRAVSKYSENILLSIGRTVREYNRKNKIFENKLEKTEHTYYNTDNNKEYEESNINEITLQGGNKNEDRIYSERGLSDSKLKINGTAGRTTDEMGIDGNGLSEGNTRVKTFPVGDTWGRQNETIGNTGQSREDVFQFSRTNDGDRKRDGEVKGRESVGMGTSGEQYQTESRGDSEGGSNLPDLDDNADFVQMTLFPSSEEQSENIAVAVAREENTLDTATFYMPDEVIKTTMLEQKMQEYVKKHDEFLKSVKLDKLPIVINAYGGPGAGKSTACMDICSELKKRGFNAEYVQEYAKELVYDKNFEMLNGTAHNQFLILKEQTVRVDRLYGNVDFIVTDSPILLNTVYNQELTPRFSKIVNELYNQYNNFSFFIERDASHFQEEGRIHNLEQSIEKDNEIKQLLEGNSIYYGKYNHDTIQKVVSNAVKTFERINSQRETLDEQKDANLNNEYENRISNTFNNPVARNFHIEDDSLGVGTVKEKYHKNIEAIKTLKLLESENRNATEEEQKILSGYVGWGGLADVFDENKPVWKNEYSELKTLLTEEEYHSARESVLNAHFTSPVIIREMYKALEKMGFNKGNILEPSCGVGNFFGLLPEKFSDSKLYGVELDDISGRIAKKLYPDAQIDITGYENTNYPNDFFDVAIGNVPFGDYRVNDKEYRNEKFLIHDYFFAKSLDKVRSGGIVAFITSKGTMDKKDDTVRRYLAERAELIGAVRLPNTAFKANAGTEVTSDIIFLKKRDGLSHDIPDWVSTGYNQDDILINNYFIEHPEMIVGEMKIVSGPFGMESTCVLKDKNDFSNKLSEALQRLEGRIELQELDSYEIDNINDVIPALPGVDNFAYVSVDEQIYYRENSIMRPVAVPKNQEERVNNLIKIRECTYRLIDLQLNDHDDVEIQEEQQKLNSLYDEFEKKYGRISSKMNAKYFDADSGYPMICSLELFEEDKFVGKADIFTRRTIKKAEIVTSVDTASEALTLSMTEKGKIDLPYMVELTGKTEDILIGELKGIMFKNPVSGHFEPADEYLSGNVRNKLAVAKTFAKTSDEFKSNVEALEKVQPKDLEASEIDVRLGATWIDKDTIMEFIKDVLKPSEYMLRWEYIKVMYSEYTHEWRIKGKNSDGSNPIVNSTYGTDRVNAYKILEDTLNLKDVRIYDNVENADGSTSRVLNQKETTIAKQKQDTLKEAFQEWVFKDRDRRVDLCQKYNEIFNSIRPREYVGDALTFPGMSTDITLKPHQKNAVARQLYGPNTLLAHCVGAGKTFEMAAAAMESKRLGLCRKSLFVVPNHLIGDWAKDFLRLYPGAKILAATKKDFTPQNRKKFCSRIATGDYDAVIIGHSQFEKIPLSIERQVEIIQSQIEEIESAIKEAKFTSGDSFSIKQMEKMRKQLKVKLEKLYDNSKKDTVVTFEQLGIDRLFVDESHYYKNLYHYTKMRNVSGLSSTEAAKSSDMYAKCMYLDEITGGTGITFATGTPISNSMTEMYTNMRYLQSKKLEELGLSYFDAWASTFGESTTEMELAPEGTGFRLKTRFAKFHNIPELISIFKECADIQTKEMLNLPVPKAEYVDVVLEPTAFQKMQIESLGERAEKIRNGSVDPKVDNMLKITNDGRFLALDERMITSDVGDTDNNKATECANKAYQIWLDTIEQKSTQLIFSDISIPNKEGKFSIYEDIKEKLINKGVPEKEIAFIHDYDTEKKKSDLFSKVRKGQVRFLFGSTQKMGAGTNVQDKLIALHHLDVPWRPSDIEQQEGRILRQGNENSHVQIFRYIKKGTFDSYSWQVIEKKQRFISQIMTSKAPVRSADDIDDATLNYAEVKALATGNPKIKEKMELDVEVQKLKLVRQSFFNQKYKLEDAIALSYPQMIEATKEKIAGYELDIRTAEEHTFQDDEFEMKIGETIFRDKKEAGDALLSMLPLAGKTSDYTQIGEYRGFQMSVAYDFINNKNVMKLKGQLSHRFHLSNDALGNITRINNAISVLSFDLEKSIENLERIEKEFDDAKIEATKEFPQEQEYQEKSMRLQELEKELNMTKETDTQAVGLEEKIETINNNVSECAELAEKISESTASLITDKDIPKFSDAKPAETTELKTVNNDISESILLKKVTELDTLEDETEISETIAEVEEKPDLERGDIFEYEGRKWKVISNDGFMLDAENTDKNSSMPFMNWIGRIKDHEYVLISKADNLVRSSKKEKKTENPEETPEKKTVPSVSVPKR
jgi:N12 class adenine-specific DNA methylase